MSAKQMAKCHHLKSGQRSGRYQSSGLALANCVRQPCIRRITATMTMQTASPNSPLHLQPADRPKPTPASANHKCGLSLRKPCMNAAIANRLKVSAKISSIAIRDCTNSLLAFFNQMLFVQSRIAMLDIFALTFSLFAIAAFMHGFRRQRPYLWFALAGVGFGLSAGCKWSGLFGLAVCIVIVAVIRLMQGWRTQFANASPDDWYRPDLWPDFRWWHFAICFALIPAAVYLATFIPLYGFSFPDILQAQRRIFGDNTTTAIAGHTYMSSWPSWPLLVRPVWYLFDKIGEDQIAAVVFLGNPLILWPALIAVAICLRDWIVTRRIDAFLVLAFYFGPYLAWALLPRTLSFIYYYLPAATTASLALVYALKRGSMPVWLLWAYVAVAFASFATMLPISAAFIGTSMATFSRLMIFQNWI